MADRFYDPELQVGQPIVLTGDEARHLARVARRVEGDLVEIFDGRGLGVSARVQRIEREAVHLEFISEGIDRRPSLDLHLYVSPPKGDRLDWLIEKATELGVVAISPLRTARSVVDPRSTKLDRLRKRVIEASKQSGRNRFMEIHETVDFSSLVTRYDLGMRFLAHPSSDPSETIRPVVSSRAALAIGPEGGWTDQEIELARLKGWTILPLGRTRLRVETAAIVGASTLIQSFPGD